MLSWFKWLVISEKAVNNISTDHIFSFKKQQFVIRFNFCDVQNKISVDIVKVSSNYTLLLHIQWWNRLDSIVMSSGPPPTLILFLSFRS